MYYQVTALLLLLPIMSLGVESKHNEPIKGLENGNIQKDDRAKEARIKELIYAKQETESAALKLEGHIQKIKKRQVAHKNVMFTIYGATSHNDPLRNEFDTFVRKLGAVFNRGDDIKPLIDSIPAHAKSVDNDLYYMYVKLVVRGLYLERMDDQLMVLVEKLRIINKELQELDPI